MRPDDINISDQWRSALAKEFDQPYFNKILHYLNESKVRESIIYPKESEIFAVYNLVNPENVKVIVLGQDPYHNPDEAMGLSFSVPKNTKVPPSLKNVYKELAADLNIPLPDHGDLTPWANQGVFLLNSILTVEKNKPGAHKNIGWQQFTDATINYLSERRSNLVFMLWGNYAKGKRNLIDGSKHLILEAAHPSPLARNAFQGCEHFSMANDYLINHHIQPIHWPL